MAESSDCSVFATITGSLDTRRASKLQKTIGETLGSHGDRISTLQDSILLHILSLLPSTREAIRTGILSKRWKYLWISIPTLIFNTRDFKRSVSTSEVDKTLVHCCDSKLKKLRIHIDYNSRYESQVRELISFAVDCNVEEIYLDFYNDGGSFALPEHLFTNGYLTTLLLSGCDFGPLRVVNWNNLRCLCISTYLSQDWIDSILQGTPALEIMDLHDCFGFGTLNITSSSVKRLVLQGYEDNCGGLDMLEIFAPNILSLNVSLVMHLRKVILRDVSTLVEANLDYTVGDTSYKNDEMEEEMLKEILQSLHHVKKLKIGINCYEVLSRLKAKGLAVLPNMKFPIDSPFHAHPDSLEDGSSGEPNVNGGPTIDVVDTARTGDDSALRNDGKRPVLDTCGPCPETFGLWHGHKVLQSHVELLLAVEKQYPQTFAYLQVRAERVWEAYLEEFGDVITSFLQTLVSDLTVDRVSDIWENLHELYVYGFDVTWAFERLQKVVELQFGKPFQQELGKLNENLHALDKEIAMLELKLAHARDRRVVLVKERDEKVVEVTMRLGVDYDQLVARSLGFGLLAGYKSP